MPEPGKDALVGARLSRQTVSRGCATPPPDPVTAGHATASLQTGHRSPVVPFVLSTLHPSSSAEKLRRVRAPPLLGRVPAKSM